MHTGHPDEVLWWRSVQVSRLCAVWVSHKHADHMLGLPALLQARSDSDRPLLVSVHLDSVARCSHNKEASPVHVRATFVNGYGLLTGPA